MNDLDKSGAEGVRARTFLIWRSSQYKVIELHVLDYTAKELGRDPPALSLLPAVL
ncbi:MAG: hypothetical protein AAGJ84_15610 [Pseudomonadota bacterium]